MPEFLHHPVFVGIIAAASGWLVGRLRPFFRHAPEASGDGEQTFDNLIEPAFLFAEKEIVDLTDSAARLVDSRPDTLTEWEALILLLEDDFPDLINEIDDHSGPNRGVIHSDANPNLDILVDTFDEYKRITLSGTFGANMRDVYEGLKRRSVRKELDVLRSVAETSPQLIWQVDEKGRVRWANATFLRYFDKSRSDDEHGQHKVWPSKGLFPELRNPAADSPVAVQSRHALTLFGDDAEHWFNVTSITGDEGTLHFATDANDQVRSELVQRAFLQTFAKTFAQLSIGLAIFDKNRALTNFNPALMEITELPVSFLASRPTIDMFLNRLRDARRLPEPRDYVSWRDQFSSLITRADSGIYQETWNLADGQTLRVTGRPHPDGALAFLFEDISAEISLTRRFRTEIETSQAVLDSLPDAIAVFSPANTLVTMNRAYHALWGTKCDDRLDQLNDLRSSLRTWKAGSASSAVWRKVEEFSGKLIDRIGWEDNFVLADGRRYNIQVQPISGGMTMVKFQMAPAITPTIQKITSNDAILVAAQAGK